MLYSYKETLLRNKKKQSTCIGNDKNECYKVLHREENGPRMIDFVYLYLLEILEMTEIFYNDRNKVICCLGLVVGR